MEKGAAGCPPLPSHYGLTNPGISRELASRPPNFLGLKDTYSEKGLEAAILRELESFILEFGTGFAFVARQKSMVIDQKDFFLDLLFYHRKLRRLVAIELKLGPFKAAHKGQMELYLRWLEKHEQQPGEEPPIGLTLCADKSDEQVELLQLDRSGIRVAAYMTELPPRALLQRKLHEAVERARAQVFRWQNGRYSANSMPSNCTSVIGPPMSDSPAADHSGRSDALPPDRYPGSLKERRTRGPIVRPCTMIEKATTM